MTRNLSTSTPLMWGLIVLGAVALFGGVSLDIEGFFGGMLQGAGFAVAALGAYFLGTLHGASGSLAEGEEPGAWLPSRDRDR